MRCTLLALPLALALLMPGNAAGQSELDPLAGIEMLVAWFTRLNAQIDQVVIAERKGQLIRAVDRLRKDLYALEADAQVLRDGVPGSRPTVTERKYLEELAAELQQTVDELVEAARAVGADLRLNEASDVEEALTSGLQVRSQTLTYLQTAIKNAEQGKWDGPGVRQRLEEGIQAVKAAQVAVTEFRRRLSPTG